jgi:hypothetical protein
MGMSPDELIAALDEIESTHLAKSASSQELQLETRRRVAEWKLKLLSERDLPVAFLEQLRRQVQSLGYTNLWIEGTIDMYFARYCVRTSHFDEARKTLEALCAKLDDALKSGSVPVYVEMKDAAERIVATIKK